MNTYHPRAVRLDRLMRALDVTARAVFLDPDYIQIFERIDAELAAELAGSSPADRVRAMIKVRKMAAA